MDHVQLESYLKEMVVMTEDKLFYYCGVCNKEGRKRQDIERHIESMHVITPPYVCEICSSDFKTKTYLQRHMRLVHK